MILVIDNYDSFTYNLVQALGALGARLEVRRNDAVTLRQIEKLAVGKIVISPGPKTPRHAGISTRLIRRFLGRLPILGVCLGHQCIGQVFGARVVRARRVMHGKVSAVTHDGKTIFKGLPNPFTAMRYHSLIVAEATVPKELAVSARTDEDEIMGLRWKNGGAPLEGVQFHPESYRTEVGVELLRNFFRL